ncbi:MAG: hypothetical protein ACLRFI_03265 [Alphaproteobacteria bacterium]
MAITVQNFVKLANFYNQLSVTVSAICVEKGHALENYVGRFFVADVLEYIVEYANRLKQNKNEVISPELENVIKVFEKQYESVKSFVSPSQKPIYEMSLEEFEKFMNI